MTPRIVDHASVSDFLASTCLDKYDNVRLNLVLGSLFQWTKGSEGMQEMEPSEEESMKNPDLNSQILVSVWEEEELR